MLGCRPERTQFSLHPPVRAQTPPLEWESRARSCVPPAVGRVRSSGWTMLMQTWAARSSAWSACCFRSTWSNRKICGPTDLAVSPVISRKDLFGSTPPMEEHHQTHPSRPRLRTLPTPGGSMAGANQTRPECHGTKLPCQNFRYLVFLKNFTFSLEITKKQ